MLDLQLTLCERFPALTPFSIRRERLYDVFNLVRRMNAPTLKKGEEVVVKNGKRMIKRAAKDNWF